MERFGLWGGCEGRQKRRRAKTATFAARTARGGVARGPATKGQSRTLPSARAPTAHPAPLGACPAGAAMVHTAPLPADAPWIEGMD